MKTNDRKNEILDVAETLFFTKGYIQTNTNEIVKEVGIARGTLYHHFKSKDDILLAIIERKVDEIYFKAHKIANNKMSSVEERLINILFAIKINEEQPELLDHLHRPENIRLHTQIEREITKRITPLMTQVVVDGVEEGLFDTSYPQEAIEMIFIYANYLFDYLAEELQVDVMHHKLDAFITNVERLLGASKGYFDF